MNDSVGKTAIFDEFSTKLESAWAEAFCALAKPGGRVHLLLNHHGLARPQQCTANQGSSSGGQDIDAVLVFSETDLLSEWNTLRAALETMKADGFVLFRSAVRTELQGETQRHSLHERARQIVEERLGARLVGRELASADAKNSDPERRTYVGVIFQAVEQSGLLRSLFDRVVGQGGVPESDAERAARLLFALSYCAFDGPDQIEQVEHLIPPEIQSTVLGRVARLWKGDRTRLDRSLAREACTRSAFELAQQRIARLESDLDTALMDYHTNTLNLVQSLEVAESQVRALAVAAGVSSGPGPVMGVVEEAKR